MSYKQKLENVLIRLYQEDKDFVHKVLLYQIDVNFTGKTQKGNNLLQLMILTNDYKGIDLLLANLINNVYDSSVKFNLINNQNIDGDTSFHLAIKNGLPHLVEKLHKLGANLKLVNNADEMVISTDTEPGTDIEPKNKVLLHNQEKDIGDSSTSDTSHIFVNNTKQQPLGQLTFSATSPQLGNIMPPRDVPMLSSDTSASEQIKTDEFFRFLEKIKAQNGGSKNIMSDTVKGKRKVDKKQIQVSQYNTDTIDAGTDTLGIGQLIMQKAGRRKKQSKRLSSKRSSKQSSKQSSKRSSKRLSSRKNKPSSDIHSEVVEIIKKMGYSEDDARYIKAGLYQMVKDKYANLSNMQRALKLKELTTQEEVEKMSKHLPKLKELVTKAREQRKNERETPEKDNSEKKTKVKEPKTSKVKKTTKA